MENVFLIAIAGNDRSTFSGNDNSSPDRNKSLHRDYVLGRLGGEAALCIGVRFEFNPLELIDLIAGLLWIRSPRRRPGTAGF